MCKPCLAYKARMRRLRREASQRQLGAAVHAPQHGLHRTMETYGWRVLSGPVSLLVAVERCRNTRNCASRRRSTSWLRRSALSLQALHW